MPSSPRPRDRAARRRRVTSVAGFLTFVLALTAVFLPTPYIVESPGPTFNTLGHAPQSGRLISIEGAQTYPTQGNLDMTTVYVAGPPTGTTMSTDVLAAWVDPDRELIPQELVYPTGTTADEVSAENTAAMTTSQDWAIAAALEELDMDYRQELSVAGFTPESQATEVLRQGDLVRTANGVVVTGLEGLKDQLNASGGDPVELGITREGVEQAVQVPVYPGPEGTWLIGVYLDSAFDFPIDVSIELDNVGGPSAGMMFALGIVDVLTPGPMTGGAHIAGTGTIDPDGTVGAIGGIPQKVVGAHEAGAEVFLAAAENCDELAGRVPEGLDVYAVSTLSQARQVVESVGLDEEVPDDVPRCG